MSSSRDDIGMFQAVCGALRNANISHFPRIESGNLPIADVVIGHVKSALKSVELGGDSVGASEIEPVIHGLRESLNEVKGLTEYQDQKASRSLTTISFLSALAGGLLTIFSKAYPFQNYLFGPCVNWRAVLVVIAYLIFGAFVLFAISGALVVFYATKSRFKWPDLSEGPKSRLFYAGIVSTSPSAWAKSFVDESSGGKSFKSAADIQEAYIKDYILETYLVAAKVADKLRYLMPAQSILYWTVIILLVWVVMIGIVAVLV